MDLTQEEKKRLYSLFKNIKETDNTELNTSLNSNVLLVDGLNLYCRAFASNVTLNSNGLHIGGIAGFLKSLGYTINLFNPTRCLIIFDGSGGSFRRKKIYSEYKAHRANKVRLNRIFEENSTTESEKDAIARQLIRVSHYLDCLPVTTIQIDNIEADDVIAYLSLQSFKNNKVTILSTDKDFYQLVNNNIKIYSPIKRKVYGIQEIVDEFNIHPNNIILYRVLDGDHSDNINGIKGCGIKTIQKAFPALKNETRYTIDDLFKMCEENKGKYKIYENVLNNKSLIERNYQLMQLSDTIITTYSQLNINDILKKKNKLNRYQLIQMIKQDQLFNVFPDDLGWLNDHFSVLDRFLVE